MATNDVITLSEAKQHLSIMGNSAPAEDAVLATYITAVSLRLDDLCGPIVIRTVSSESHDGGEYEIFLRKAPVATVTSVVEYNQTTATSLTAETNAAKTGNDYLVDLPTGKLIRRTNGVDYRFNIGRKNIVVTYTAGRAASTSAVDSKFKLAAGMMLAHLWRREQGLGSETFGPFEVNAGVPAFAVPRAVENLLADELRPPAVM